MNDFLQQISNSGVDALTRIQAVSDSAINQYNALVAAQERAFNTDDQSPLSFSDEVLIFVDDKIFSLGEVTETVRSAVQEAIVDETISDIDDIAVQVTDYAQNNQVTLTIKEYSDIIQEKIDTASANCEILKHAAHASSNYDAENPSDDWITDLELPAIPASQRSDVKLALREISKASASASGFVNGILNFVSYTKAALASDDDIWNELWTKTMNVTTLSGIRGVTPGEMVFDAMETTSDLVQKVTVGAIQKITKELFKPFGLQRAFWKIEKNVMKTAYDFIKFSGKSIADTAKWYSDKLNRKFVDPDSYSTKNKKMGLFDLGLKATIAYEYDRSQQTETESCDGLDNIADFRDGMSALSDGVTTSFFGVEYSIKDVNWAAGSIGHIKGGFNCIRRVNPFDFEKWYTLNKRLVDSKSPSTWTFDDYVAVMSTANDCFDMDPSNELAVLNSMSYQLAFASEYMARLSYIFNDAYAGQMDFSHELAGDPCSTWNTNTYGLCACVYYGLLFGKDMFEGNIGTQVDHKTERRTGGGYGQLWIEYSNSASNVDFAEVLTRYQVVDSGFNYSLRSVYNDYFVDHNTTYHSDEYVSTINVESTGTAITATYGVAQEFYRLFGLVMTNLRVKNDPVCTDLVTPNPLYGSDLFPYYKGYSRVSAKSSVNSDALNMNKAWKGWFTVTGALLAATAGVFLLTNLGKFKSWRIGLQDRYSYLSFARGNALTDGDVLTANSIWRQQKKVKSLLYLTGGTAAITGLSASLISDDVLPSGKYQSKVIKSIEDVQDTCSDTYSVIV